jgi:predicted nucleic acid-binding protein
MELIADTTFLIGLWRQQRWAQAFAEDNPSLSVAIPWVVLGEFWHGAVKAGHDPEAVRRFLSLGLPLNDTEAVVPVYARICASLQDKGVYRKIGQNDLWIAATSVAFEKPLVSRNRRHFEEVEGLQLIAIEK